MPVVSLPFLRARISRDFRMMPTVFIPVDDGETGRLATQEADVAETIAAGTGADVEVAPLDPVLRALLLTGDRAAYLRTALGGHHGDSGAGGWEPLWWPPAKVAGVYLAPFLAENIEPASGERP